MKTLSTLVLAVLISLSGHTELKAQTGGFGGPVFKITQFDGQTGLMFGGLGAGVGTNFYFGGGGFGLTNTGAINTQITDFGYGGLLFGYRNTVLNRLGVYGQGLVGWGGGELGGTQDFSAFVLEPELGASLQMFEWFTLRTGLSRRIAIPTSGINNGGSLSGNAFVLSLIFG